jgi:hypothetical protein
MKNISLNGNRKLALERYSERYDKRLRLVILNNKGEEMVCRKESFGKLEQFLQTKEAHIFKGRLQLSKHLNKISVEVKGEVLGVIDVALLAKNLQELAVDK